MSIVSGGVAVHRARRFAPRRSIPRESARAPLPPSPPPHPPQANPTAAEAGRARGVCNSIRSADAPAGTAHLVRVTHPFHPLSGRQFTCVGERYNRYGKRLLLQVDAGTVCSVPPQWTDVVAPDPAIAIGKRRAVFRVADLMELAQLVADLSRHGGRSEPMNVR